jgi:membrane-associated phospholipid phosphatase
MGCGEPTAPRERTAGAEAATWSTWVLANGSVLRPSAPPGDTTALSRTERDEIVARQRARTPATDSLIRLWDVEPTSPWTRLAVERLDFYWPLLPDVRLATPARAARIMALLHVALHDALVAAWDAKFAYGRRAPTRADTRIRLLSAPVPWPSYPSEHAAVGAAAAAILSYAFPIDDTAAYTRMAREAADSRIVAGAVYPSDVDAGWQLGRAVAERVIARAMHDGSALPWTGAVPAGTGMWQPTPPRRVGNPFDPLAGTWRTWVLPSGSIYRLAAPPAIGSARFDADLEELRRLAHGERTLQHATAARYWATDAPSTRWESFMDEELTRRAWSAPYAARARAYVSVAMFDAFVACWDSKYAHWLMRPVTADPSLTTVFSTPPFPSYPSGHSTISTAAAVVMSALFPDRATEFHHRAEEASFSRVWGGVHYRFDIVDGDSLGAKVGRDVVARLTRDAVP